MRFVTCLVLVALCLAGGIHPAGGTTLFGLVDTGELFASSDGGATWTVRATLAISDAVGIAAGETSDELFIITRSGLVYRSTDAGVNWAAVGAVTADDVVDMLIRPNGDIFLLSRTGILWQSTDDGVTFTSHSILTASNHVSMTADDSDYIYILTQTGEVAKSIDEGVSWNTVGVVTTSEAVEIRAKDSDLFVLTGSGDIARSTDGCATWTIIGTISQVHMSSLTLDGTDLVAATTEGLIASSADGATWTWVGSINQLTVVSLGNDTPTGTGIGPDRPPSVTTLQLNPPWPNPISGQGGLTSFLFTLPQADAVTIELYNIEGKLVRRRPSEKFTESGEYIIQWDPGKLASGVYFIRLTTTQGLKAHRKLAVVR
jgi:photosystem II stability/assembly factor-like uncharacterized protein